MSDDIPQWAKERACELANEAKEMPGYWNPEDVVGCNSPLTALARYIAKHEQPPGDPDLITAREICAQVAYEIYSSDLARIYREGGYDNTSEIKFALAKLKEARKTLHHRIAAEEPRFPNRRFCR